MASTAWIYSTQFEFWSPQLHQHLHLLSTSHLNNKTNPLTPDLHWHQYLHLCILYQLLDSRNLYKQMSSTLYTTTFPVYLLVHCIGLLPTPLPQTTHGHLAAFCITFCRPPLIITLVLFIFTLMLLISTLSFHSLLPSVLWCCWLDGRNGIRPVKNWLVGCWHGYLFGVRCRFAYGPADATRLTVSCSGNPDWFWFYLSSTGSPR